MVHYQKEALYYGKERKETRTSLTGGPFVNFQRHYTIM